MFHWQCLEGLQEFSQIEQHTQDNT
uniref:Uncharacterized protein n=1 Tax=Anguilla anguilla TaxID=7936 RepID=A0A0E9QWC5_ANGAN